VASSPPPRRSGLVGYMDMDGKNSNLDTVGRYHQVKGVTSRG